MSSDTSSSGVYTSDLDEEAHADSIEVNSGQALKPIKSLSEILQEITSGAASSQTKTVQQLKEVVESGTECDVQTLYEGPAKCQCCKNWTDVYPDDLKSSIEQEAETKKKALVIRLGKNHNEGGPLALDSIVVQNRQLKELLGQVFHGYRGITANLKKLVFRAPFRPFFHRWDLFKDLVAEQKANGDDASPFSQIFYRILDLELRETMDEVGDLCSQGVITFGLLWALFKPGMRLYSSASGHDRFFILQGSDYARGGCPYFSLAVRYVDWDGDEFGFATSGLRIEGFSGTMKITELSVYPAKYHESEQQVASALKVRGEAFHSLRGMHYKAYADRTSLEDKYNNGVNASWIWTVSRCFSTVNAKLYLQSDARVVIDASTAPSEWTVHGLAPLDDFSLSPEITVIDDVHKKQQPRWPGHGRVPYMPMPPTRPLAIPVVLKPENPAKQLDTLTEEQLMLCNSHVIGYFLKDKAWDKMAVDRIKEVTWNEDAFPSLILPQGHKGLILAFVNGQLTHQHEFDDVIEGKGQGLTILLVGTPGTGKTLTAEAVADKVRRPLYILSAGELGQDAEKVEEKLKSVLELAEKWRAVLLLDECDVFLERRTHNNLNHNEVVAVFLRLLEYYPGMLFLTTNRAEAIDPAFQSRIHLTLHYPELNSEARGNIWRQFSSRSLQSSLSDDDLKGLSELPLNGRQIKNIIKISSLLAKQEGTALRLEHIQMVLSATKELGHDT